MGSRRVDRLDDETRVRAQYADSRNFDARVRIYELYGQNDTPLMPWLFDRLGLEAGEHVLEVGCGTGNLWRENAARLPARLDLTLTDRSRGMIAAAKQRLVPSGVLARFALADIRALPIPSGSTDLVIANHMLYHVTDRESALAELARVVAGGGRCIVGTNDWPHMIELRELLARFEIPSAMLRPGRDPHFFDAENAAAELRRHFDALTTHRYRDALRVTDVDVMMAYVGSLMRSAEAPPSAIGALRDHVATQIRRLGHLALSTSVVVFEARCG